MARTRGVRDNRQAYVYGNTVREIQVEPRREDKRSPKRKINKRRRSIQRTDHRQVLFLVFAVTVLVASSILFLQFQTSNAVQAQAITDLENQINDLKIENDVINNKITNSKNMEEIREDAIELGMQYYNKDEVIEYNDPSEGYVKQYDEVPSNGIVVN